MLSSRKRRPAERSLRIESLEDRSLNATFTVTNLSDAGPGSLRQAILDANGNNNDSVVDRIVFDASLNQARLNLESSLPIILQTVNITGPGTTSDSFTIAGGTDIRPMQVGHEASHVTIANLALVEGVFNEPDGLGGGLLNTGPDTRLNNVRIADNQAFTGSGIANGTEGTLLVSNCELTANTGAQSGGAIHNAGHVTILNSKLISNEAGSGPALHNGGTATVRTSTISANVGGDEGAIFNGNNVSLFIDRTLISENTGSFGAGAIFSMSPATIINSTITGNRLTSAIGPGAGGIFSNSSLVLVNSTIVRNTSHNTNANNAGGVNSTNGGTVSAYNTVISLNNASTGAQDTNGQVGGGNNYLGGSPRLGALADNGGPTFTIAPLSNSPLIDEGSNEHATVTGQIGNAALKTDQRGLPRIDDGTVDIGAVEVVVQPATTRLLVADGSDRVYRYNVALTSGGTELLNAANSTPWDIATNAAGTRRWVGNGTKTIFVYDGQNTKLGAWTANGLSGKPTGLAIVGNDVYVVDQQADKVFVFAGQANRLAGAASPTRSFSLVAANHDAEGIASNGKLLFVVNDKDGAARDQVFRYNLQGAAQGSFALDAADTTPVGIAVDPTGASSNLWVVDDANKIFQYDGGVSFASGVHTASVSRSLAKTNTNPVGIAYLADTPAQSAAANHDAALVAAIGSGNGVRKKRS